MPKKPSTVTVPAFHRVETITANAPIAMRYLNCPDCGGGFTDGPLVSGTVRQCGACGATFRLGPAP